MLYIGVECAEGVSGSHVCVKRNKFVKECWIFFSCDFNCFCKTLISSAWLKMEFVHLEVNVVHGAHTWFLFGPVRMNEIRTRWALCYGEVSLEERLAFGRRKLSCCWSVGGCGIHRMHLHAIVPQSQPPPPHPCRRHHPSPPLVSALPFLFASPIPRVFSHICNPALQCMTPYSMQ